MPSPIVSTKQRLSIIFNSNLNYPTDLIDEINPNKSFLKFLDKFSATFNSLKRLNAQKLIDDGLFIVKRGDFNEIIPIN